MCGDSLDGFQPRDEEPPPSRTPNMKAHIPETAIPSVGCRVKESACISSFHLQRTTHQSYDNSFPEVCHYLVGLLIEPKDTVRIRPGSNRF